MDTPKVNDDTPTLSNKYIFNSNKGSFESSSKKAAAIPANLQNDYPVEAIVFLDKFIKGPLPMPGILVLARMNSDKILFTVLLIFYLVSFNKDEAFKFPYQYSDLFGLARSTVKRHLKQLAKLELIELNIQHSKSPVVRVDLKKWGYIYVNKI